MPRFLSPSTAQWATHLGRREAARRGFGQAYPLGFRPGPSFSTTPFLFTRQRSRMADATATANAGDAPAGAAAATVTVDGAGDEAEAGFSRAEFGKEMLVGTVQFYERHVFLCYKGPDVWPNNVEGTESDRLPRILSQAINNRKGDMKKKTRLTICEGDDGSDSESSNGDVFIFPDMVRYRRLTHFDAEAFVEFALVQGTGFLPGNPEKIEGSYVFVCAHGSRDKRCGVCGPALINRFREEISAQGLEEVHVSACSHIGGHKYAGNVIIFKSNDNGEVSGHWYGYVAPDDVPVLLKEHIKGGNIVNHLWRGQMGLDVESQKKYLEMRLNPESSLEETPSVEEQPSTAADDGTTGCSANGTCCQVVSGTTCCQAIQNGGTVERTAPLEQDASVENSGKKDHLKSADDGKKGSSTRKPSMPTWFESWDRSDTYAALAVVTAVASVFVAYSFYKRSR